MMYTCWHGFHLCCRASTDGNLDFEHIKLIFIVCAVCTFFYLIQIKSFAQKIYALLTIPNGNLHFAAAAADVAFN